MIDLVEKFVTFWRSLIGRYGKLRVAISCFGIFMAIFGPLFMPYSWRDELFFAVSVMIVYFGWRLISKTVVKKRQSVKAQSRNQGNIDGMEHIVPPPANDFEEQRYVIDTTKLLSELTVDDFVAIHDRTRAKIKAPSANDLIYWNENPHVKHFLKRLWRIIVAWIAVIAGVVLVSGTHYGAFVIVFVILSGVMYTWRRVKKWQDLRLAIIGDWVFIQEAKNPWLFLNGARRAVPVLACNNVSSRQTVVELLLRLRCGQVDINTPIDQNDWFRFLQDVRRYEEFERILRQRFDEIMAGSNRGFET